MTQQQVCQQRTPYKQLGIAYALLIFLGTLGMHRFYLNHVWRAVGLLFLSVIALPLVIYAGFLSTTTYNETADFIYGLRWIVWGILAVWIVWELATLHLSVRKANLAAGWN